MATTSITKQGTDTTKRTDLLKWLSVAGIWIAGIIGSFFVHYYLMASSLYQIILWVAVIIISGYIAFLTTSGAQLWMFFKDAQIELRKIVWPNRQEALQATFMVLVAVIVMSLLLWLIDTVLFHAISYISNM